MKKNKWNKFFTSKAFYVISAIFLAIMLFVHATSVSMNNQNSNSDGQVYTASIPNVPITLKYDSNKYFVSGYNTSASVYLTGSNRLLLNGEMADDTRNFSLVADLSNSKEGTVNVPIRVQNLASGLNAKIQPTTLNATIEKKAQAEFQVSYQIEQNQIPSGFSIDEVNLDVASVNVISGDQSIKRIQAVEASLPSNITLNDDFSGDVSLHAVDSNGNIVPAQISPSTVHMRVKVNKPSKKVNVNVKKTGTLDSSLSDMKVSVNPNQVTIYGEQAILDKISTLDAPVDISGVTSEKKIKVKLQTNDNISFDNDTVEVTLTPVKK
ncbi:MAG: CdaR family protein [Streptococcaceae bacterium]|nr:CdaR family protein [Streptococcaceae bacterium]MCL2681332.1 CdaR family protein [Streptococcaceae bacterium]MCL2858886.1 CdaR family protein [Streptococcaceae bacterium]